MTNVRENSAELIELSNAPTDISLKAKNACTEYCEIVTGKKCNENSIERYVGSGGDPGNTFEIILTGKNKIYLRQEMYLLKSIAHKISIF